MKTSLLAAAATAAALAATSAAAEPVAYTLDPSHSQVMFTYDHLGYSTTYNMFAGWEGQIMFDKEDPANSSVEVSIPLMSLYTGWEDRLTHFMGDDFFAAQEGDLITFKSTAIEVTGDDEAIITGDLTMNGITKSVQLETELNMDGQHPMQNKAWLGFDAETTILRSDFGVGAYAPNISDELDVEISIEAGAAE
ncbi:YceI family protein [Roseovarius nanhaiticus]|uniref:Polyisoprenoid-binding protein YceI n=1 Tax=Roseovarius nanhaiticus TaxID=573024 RepID=A0A1N7FPM8_9RHOB|nr:YceI family protein [Roseovarius nanhaiticus]SEK48854.1 Polyisoprenoid-binding protein YceI [Roseovarius nanhaiticus]SIS02312.1 Polyisoprenoid-binding protein YceI [Roseovarius nanhaiticus]